MATPTTTTGFVSFAILGIVLSLGLMAAARKQPVLLVGLLATLFPLWDLLAWMTATDAERERFLAEIAAVKRANPGPGEKVVGVGKPAFAIAFGLVGVAMLLAGAYLYPPLIAFSLFFFAFSVVSVVDVLRRPPEQ